MRFRPVLCCAFGLVLVATLAAIPVSLQAASQTLTPIWIGEADMAGANYGQSVASAGDVNGDGYADVIVGTPYFQNANGYQGRAFVYYGSGAGLPTTPSWFAEGLADDQAFGWSVSGAGDVNGDGYDDVIVGAPSNNRGAFLFLGSATGLGTSPAWAVYGPTSYGSVVAGLGDTNGDGYDDFAVLAPTVSPGLPGELYVYMGSASGPATAPALILGTIGIQDGTANPPPVGISHGDFNGDGYSDVIVRDNIYLGSPSGPGTTPDWVPGNIWPVNGSSYGAACAGVGDINGDGFDDFVIGAPRYTGTQTVHTHEGRIYFYNGSAGVPDNWPERLIESDVPEAFFGSAVAGAGDVNGDGYDDVMVGAYNLNNQGRAYVYLGSALSLATSPTWTADGTQPMGLFGKSVAGLGDVNGTGVSAVIVGASQIADPENLEGQAYIYQMNVVGVPGETPVHTLQLAAAPNPSSGDTELHYALPVSGPVTLTVHDIMGRTVAVLVDQSEEAGPHTVRWSGQGPSGVYVARLETPAGIRTFRMVRTR
jgi:hypothetical protein